MNLFQINPTLLAKLYHMEISRDTIWPAKLGLFGILYIYSMHEFQKYGMYKTLLVLMKNKFEFN